jgi:regulator of PEP synthase PpsR (kinase-PPPase family)
MNRSVFFISDGTGITAETLGHSLLAQFGSVTFEQFTLPYIDNPERAHQAVLKINEVAAQDGVNPSLLIPLLIKKLGKLLLKPMAVCLMCLKPL